MKPNEFVKAYYPFAKQTQDKTGLSCISILAQAALESGWGAHAPGNMFFGVKDTDGINGNEQLIITTEYSKRTDLKFPLVISIVPVTIKGEKFFKYTVKDWFRKYNTPEESFTAHAMFFQKNNRYKQAWEVRAFHKDFFAAIAKAGYATDPNYSNTLCGVAETIKKHFVIQDLTV